MRPVASKGQATRNQILDAALRLASVLGLEGLTIGELAKSVGMSKSGLYAHFQAKDSLQLQVLEQVRDRFVDHVLRPAFRSPRGEPRVRGILKHWVEYLENPRTQAGASVFIAASFELDDRPGPLRDFLIQTHRELFGNLEKAVRLAIEEGHFHSSAQPQQFAFEMHSLVMGFQHAQRLLQETRSKDWLFSAFDQMIARAKNENIPDNKRV